MKNWKRLAAVVILNLAVFSSHPAQALDVERLSDADIAAVKNLIVKLTPLIQEREKKKDLAKLTFAELYDPLEGDERAFIQSFRDLDGKSLGVKIPYQGIASGQEELTTITGQKVWMRLKAPDGRWQKKSVELPPQFLPPQVYAAHLKMMRAMQKELGRQLYVDSGYRSSAYQLYLFVYYLQNHNYSIRETVKWVALPGFSEHGAPKHQAIDFINQDGVSGEDDPSKFEALDEYRWLLDHAGEFGFVLSYPKDAPVGITFEPWHWRFKKEAEEKSEDGGEKIENGGSTVENPRQ